MTEIAAAALRDHLVRWELRSDGDAIRGSRSVLLPVRTSDGVAAMVKVVGALDEGEGGAEPDSEDDHLVLRRWDGRGAVRLLRADPHRRVVLVERAGPQSLRALSDVAACEVVAGLYGRLHVAAMPQLPLLTDDLVRWTTEFEALPRNAPVPRRLVEQALTLGRDLAADGTGGAVVHGDLHYGNVLAADREPWLAIAPKPRNGDPHFELAPMLLHRWDELSGHVREGIRTRFYTLVDVAGFDEERARAWIVVRSVAAAVREVGRGADADATVLTRCVALAKAVGD